MFSKLRQVCGHLSRYFLLHYILGKTHTSIRFFAETIWKILMCLAGSVHTKNLFTKEFLSKVSRFSRGIDCATNQQKTLLDPKLHFLLWIQNVLRTLVDPFYQRNPVKSLFVVNFVPEFNFGCCCTNLYKGGFWDWNSFQKFQHSHKVLRQRWTSIQVSQYFHWNLRSDARHLCGRRHQLKFSDSDEDQC